MDNTRHGQGNSEALREVQGEKLERANAAHARIWGITIGECVVCRTDIPQAIKHWAEVEIVLATSPHL